MRINSWIFIDFETGGFDPRKHAVTEVAAVAIKGDTLEKIDMVSTFIKPYGNYGYDPEALKHTGITMEEIENGIPVEQAVQELINLLSKADLYPKTKSTRNFLVAHNSAFDKGFLLQLFDHTKKLKELEKLTYGVKDYYGNYQPEMMDSIFLPKMIWGADEEMTSFNLTNSLTKAGIELNDAHRAINDTIGMKDMFVSFTSNLRSGMNANEDTGVKSRVRDHWQF